MHKIDIKLKPSSQFILLILCGLIGSMVIVASLPIALWARGVLAIITLSYSLVILYTHGLLKAKKSIIQFSIRGKEWLISDQDRIYSVKLCGSSTVTTWASILRFKVTGEKSKRSCVVFQDSIGQDQYRKMIVSARF